MATRQWLRIFFALFLFVILAYQPAKTNLPVNPVKILRPLGHPFVLIGSLILIPISPRNGWSGLFLYHIIKGLQTFEFYSMVGIVGICILVFFWIRSKGRGRNNIERFILAAATYCLFMSIGWYLFADEDQFRDDCLNNWLTLLCFAHFFHLHAMGMIYQILPMILKWLGADPSAYKE